MKSAVLSSNIAVFKINTLLYDKLFDRFVKWEKDNTVIFVILIIFSISQCVFEVISGHWPAYITGLFWDQLEDRKKEAET